MAGKKKQDQPSMRERRLVDGVVRGEPVKTAARAAGYAASTAASNAYLILDRPRVRTLLTEALERAGVTEDQLATILLQALQAHVHVVNTRKMTAAETELPDHAIRLAAVEKIAGLYGYVTRKVDIPTPPASLVVNITEQKPGDQPKERQPVERDDNLTIRLSVIGQDLSGEAT